VLLCSNNDDDDDERCAGNDRLFVDFDDDKRHQRDERQKDNPEFQILNLNVVFRVVDVRAKAFLPQRVDPFKSS
jgi:hypothetical protein